MGAGRRRGPGWAFCPGCGGSSDPTLSPEDHEWLLSEEVDVLPFLLLPLAGPEEFPEDEMESKRVSERAVGVGGPLAVCLPLRLPLPPGLPLDLQYLPPDKQREEEPDIRKMLLEAVMLVGPSGANGGGAEGEGLDGGSCEQEGARGGPECGRASGRRDECWAGGAGGEVDGKLDGTGGGRSMTLSLVGGHQWCAPGADRGPPTESPKGLGGKGP